MLSYWYCFDFTFNNTLKLIKVELFLSWGKTSFEIYWIRKKGGPCFLEIKAIFW